MILIINRSGAGLRLAACSEFVYVVQVELVRKEDI